MLEQPMVGTCYEFSRLGCCPLQDGICVKHRSLTRFDLLENRCLVAGTPCGGRLPFGFSKALAWRICAVQIQSAMQVAPKYQADHLLGRPLPHPRLRFEPRGLQRSHQNESRCYPLTMNPRSLGCSHRQAQDAWVVHRNLLLNLLVGLTWWGLRHRH
jgi:hypothetical protein